MNLIRKIFGIVVLVIFSLLITKTNVYAVECGQVLLNSFAGGFTFSAQNCNGSTTYTLNVKDPHGNIVYTTTLLSDGSGNICNASLSAPAICPTPYNITLSSMTAGTYKVILTNPAGTTVYSGTFTSTCIGDCNPNLNSGITCTPTGGGTGISTAIGCIPIANATGDNGQNLLIGFILKWAIGIGGGIAFLLILAAGFQIMTSRGDPNQLKAGQELMTSAIAGLLLLVFSIIILRIIGFDILQIKIFQ